MVPWGRVIPASTKSVKVKLKKKLQLSGLRGCRQCCFGEKWRFARKEISGRSTDLGCRPWRATRCRRRLLSIGDDYWIEDEGNKVFRVNGKAMRVRDTWILEDAARQRGRQDPRAKLSVRDRCHRDRDRRQGVTVKKALVGIRDRFTIDLEDGEDLKANGNFVDHEYEIERDGKGRRVSKKWFRVRDTYGVQIARGRRRRAAPRDHRLHRRAFWPRVARCFGRKNPSVRIRAWYRSPAG